MRLIDADALIDFIDMGHLRNPLESCFSEWDVVDMLESRPVLTLDDLRPKGQWVVIEVDKQHKRIEVECSECGAVLELDMGLFGLNYNFCPNCGADMDPEDANGQN